MIEFLQRFVGFSLVTRRVIADRQPRCRGSRLDNGRGKKLRVKFFHHGALEGARREFEFFRVNPDAFEVDGPFPTVGLDREEVRRTLADHMWDGCLCLTAPRGEMDHVQHFSCHCDTTRDSADDYTIYLAGSKDEEHPVSMGFLEEKWVEKWAENSAREDGLPLVFLNACGTAKVCPYNPVNFPRFCLTNGNAAFVGTEVHVPDRVAADFSRQLYIEMLRRRPLAEAILAARWKLLQHPSRPNPLGLFYTMYGDPNLRVSRAVIVQE